MSTEGGIRRARQVGRVSGYAADADRLRCQGMRLTGWPERPARSEGKVLDQTVMGRALGYGRIVVAGTGRG